ncbi:MAG: carbamoyltransferase HypF [Spirochaetes bacterium]|nr:carbamoyltransferase HypF [Spirochaetota bacterium]
MHELKTFQIRIKGIVQGIGFRPFVFDLSKKFKIKGYVLNDSDSVIILAQQNENHIKKFIKALKEKKPDLAFYKSFEVDELTLNKKFENFIIKKSLKSKNSFLSIAADISLCESCLTELFDKKNRRYQYPFTGCTKCGPRFTITKEMPYDRETTVLKKFKMCKDCEKEYFDPSDRRFHSQNNACFSCGPVLKLIDNNNKLLIKGIDETSTVKIFKQIAEFLNSGKIIAIKGIGGYHIACDAFNDEAIKLLRKRKNRPAKPFAVMMKDIKEVEKHTEITLAEKKRLQEKDRSIILLKKKRPEKLSKFVSPDNNYLGIMLPYTPVHYLMFKYFNYPLIMTSANISEEPIIINDNESIKKLSKICDFFLTGDRDIIINSDDSVVKLIKNKDYFIRRSRGFVPNVLTLNNNNKKEILALGAENNNIICLIKNNNAILSNHIGDLKSLETFKLFKKSIRHLTYLYKSNPDIIACDMHRQYLNTQFAINIPDEFDHLKKAKIFEVQHHHAHAASCMVDNNLNHDVIAIILDGTGYGPDDTVWGGEILIANFKKFKRIGNFKQALMPGGESAIINPWKMAISYIYEIFKSDWIDMIPEVFSDIKKEQLDMTIYQIKNNINTPLTSSCGRLFDAVSSLCGLCLETTYDGQPAIMLENAINDEKKIKDHYCFEVTDNLNHYTLDWSPVIKNIIKDLKNKISVSKISKRFHFAIISGLSNICKLIRDKTLINDIVLSGGCFMNFFLLNKLTYVLKKEKFNVFTHKNTPCNDAGISLGQAVIACENS